MASRTELKETLSDCENALMRTRAELAVVVRQRDEVTSALHDARVEAGVAILRAESLETKLATAEAQVAQFLELYKKTVDRYEKTIGSMHIFSKWQDEDAS